MPDSPSSAGMIKIFVVEDDAFFGMAIQKTLEKENNYDVKLFKTGAEFLAALHENPDIVTIDYNLPDMNGLEILHNIINFNKAIIPIVISGQDKVEVVVQAYKNGAKDYLLKDANIMMELVKSVKSLSEQVSLRHELDTLREQIIDRNKYAKIIGESPAILSVLRMIQKVEKSNMLVLVTGESGTGKEGIATAIHYGSPRARRPFVLVNMASIPVDLTESELFGHEKGAFTGADSRRIGKFEEAHEGTIFLDEIGEMDMNLQAKLLRVLQENTITRVGSNKEIKLDTRVVAATNKNLAQMVKDGKFREDLFYRLQGFLIKLPPLKDRGNDVLLLAQHFLDMFTASNKMPAMHISKPAKESLLAHPWPGNVRELKATIERAALMCDGDTIQKDDIIYT